MTEERTWPAGSGATPGRAAGLEITRTRLGLRLSQHGVVLSELRTSPGPTHSVFDVLAALVAVLSPRGRVAVLGFAGGGLMAPLQALGVGASLCAVDLDPRSYGLFRRHCPAWADRVRWDRGDAVRWLGARRGRFDLILEDLSVASGGEVIKPAVSWGVLPGLIRRRLASGGVMVSNLLLPPSGRWEPELGRLAGGFPEARVVDLEEFENRILIGGARLPSARGLAARVGAALGGLGSRQAGRVRVRRVGATGVRAGADRRSA